MSLGRVSYLESWEHHPPPFIRRQPSFNDAASGDGETISRHSRAQSPDTAFLHSSLPSSFSNRAVRHRLSFNPVVGRGWAHSSAAEPDEEHRPLFRSDVSPDLTVRDGVSARLAEEGVAVEDVFRDPKWDTAVTTPAFEVSSGKRILQVAVAVTYCLLAAGPVFGFAAIKPVFIREGVYRNRCTSEELEHGFGLCYGQETRLNLMFTIAAVATNICALPVGTLLDTYGPRVSGIIGSVLIAIGALLLAIASRIHFDAYIPGYLFLALGGPFVFISSFQLSNAFPSRSGLILSLLTGAFDASSALFLIFRLINEKTDGMFTVQKFFTIYLIVPVFILLAELFIMPGTSYKTAGELVLQAEQAIVAEANDTVDESLPEPDEAERQREDRRAQRQDIVNNIQGLLEGSNDRKIDDVIFREAVPEAANHQIQEPVQKPDTRSPVSSDNKHRSGGVWGAMHGASALQQIRSPWFILITVFTVLQMLRINYFVATVRSQYDYLLGSPELAKQLNEFFDLALPVGGLIAIPFIGTVLDTASTAMVLFALVSTSTIIGILGCIPGNTGFGYANVILFVAYRPFYYTAVSDYVAKVFGFQTFGKVYGLVIALAGICNFLQTGLDALTFKVFHRNPTPANIILTVAVAVVGFFLVTYVSSKARALAHAHSQTDGTGEEQALISEDQSGGQNGGSYGTV
ncbi:MFS transporter Fmp42, putative [Talaromyces stipitatus ATCC 10500]|uniref:MFS transporter Fmp42, putative n=1 Tax=Talaromyces stipitatus (strain ATCC 10500 / CBS 375.48 / QM 6759 / NRRL 1006) TaxID=441959 RepID=B8M676_TALSN|nr:MFS transporter Fmp42, putative [Talaromyces stipitatus ATCC 10500]EED19076.1 MFS transporter Fmp42, putative [Talaromyces stipitatus ATCC 10500]